MNGLIILLIILLGSLIINQIISSFTNIEGLASLEESKPDKEKEELQRELKNGRMAEKQSS